MKFKYVCFLIIYSCFTVVVLSQNSTDILCRIVDSESKYPVSFATIKFEESNRGIVADEDGEFRLPLQYLTTYRVISISSIGFESLTVEVNTLKPDILNLLILTSKVEPLNAVFVSAKADTKTLSSEEIILKSIDKIPLNYPNTPHSYLAYYRDYQLVNNEYYNLNEGILENYDAGFNTSKLKHKGNVTALYSYDLNRDFYMDSVLLKSVYGSGKTVNTDESAWFNNNLRNELEVINGNNPIRNYDKLSVSFIDIFKNNFVVNHYFTLEKVTYLDGIPLYEITFLSKNTENTKFRSQGSIVISKSDYAIYKIEYKIIQDDNFASITTRRLDNNSYMTRERLNTLFELRVEYKPLNNKMYLNYMTFNNRFVIKESNLLRVEEFMFDYEEEAFYIKFNKPIDASSITRKNRFKLFYKDKKLIIKSLELVEDTKVKIEMMDVPVNSLDFIKDAKTEDFSYDIKRIKDISGNTINKASAQLGFQFRELFTQEIFENKTPPSEFIYVMKNRPLSATNVNAADFNINKYWVNSPLNKTKDTN